MTIIVLIDVVTAKVEWEVFRVFSQDEYEMMTVILMEVLTAKAELGASCQGELKMTTRLLKPRTISVQTEEEREVGLGQSVAGGMDIAAAR